MRCFISLVLIVDMDEVMLRGPGQLPNFSRLSAAAAAAAAGFCVWMC